MLSKILLQGRRSAAFHGTRAFASLADFATVDPENLTEKSEFLNLVGGEWSKAENQETIIDPLNGKPLLKVQATSEGELSPFVASLRKTPKTGLHNPFKNPERYLLYGDVCRRTTEMLYDEKIWNFFVRMI